jgi:HSP20 family protein
MSAPSNPFDEMERFFERMNQQLGEMPGTWDPERAFGQWQSEFDSVAVDLVERDEEFVATVDLPGFERDDVHVTVTDSTLRIDAEREESVEDEGGQFIRRERRHQSTRRSIRIPDTVDKKNVEARMENGVLTMRLPKSDPETSHDIDIQ